MPSTGLPVWMDSDQNSPDDCILRKIEYQDYTIFLVEQPENTLVYEDIFCTEAQSSVLFVVRLNGSDIYFTLDPSIHTRYTAYEELTGKKYCDVIKKRTAEPAECMICQQSISYNSMLFAVTSGSASVELHLHCWSELIDAAVEALDSNSGAVVSTSI